MTRDGRLRRLVLRAIDSPTLYDKRNKKADQQFERWWRGVLTFTVYREGRYGTYTQHVLIPTGQRLIHKGRKP